jgi:hypothetical protein
MAETVSYILSTVENDEIDLQLPAVIMEYLNETLSPSYSPFLD